MASPAPMLVFGTFPPSPDGSSAYVHRLWSSLRRSGVEASVLTSRGGATPDEVADPTVHRVVSDWLTAIDSHPEYITLRELFERGTSNVVHTFYPAPRVGDDSYRLLPAIVDLSGLPAVSTVFGLNVGTGVSTATRLRFLELLWRSRVIVTHDPEYARALRVLTLGRKPIRLVPVSYTFALPLGEAPYVWRPSQTPSYQIAYFGGIDKSRGLEDLVAALLELRSRKISPTVRMVGQTKPDGRSSDFARGFERLLRSSGVADRFEWTGYLRDRDAVEALVECDLGVLPFRRNTLGRTTLATFLSVGLPTIVCAPTATIGPLRSGENVLVARRADPRDLAAAIATLLLDGALRKRIGLGGQAISSWFSWKGIVEGYLSTYAMALRQEH